jgi:hypothetical protein
MMIRFNNNFEIPQIGVGTWTLRGETAVWQRQLVAFFPLFLLLLVLSSCEKPLMEGVSEDESSENRVVLTVGEVETYINGEPTRSSLPIEQVCSRLCFAVYQGGTRIKYDNQKVGDSDFGTCTMTLDAGH